MLKANNPSICGMRVRCGEFHCLIAQCIMCSLRLRTCIRRHALCSGIHFRNFFNATLRFQLSMIDLINGVLQSKQKKTAMKTIIFGIGVCVCCGDGCVR